MKNTIAISTLLLLGLATTACAQQESPRPARLEVEALWVRATPPNAPVAGGFLTVHNRGPADDRLLAVESATAQRVEIHEMRHVDGVARMRELEQGLPLPAGSTVELKPGGYHLMFIQPARPFVAGERIAATLVFEKAGRRDASFEVRPLGATSGKPAHH